MTPRRRTDQLAAILIAFGPVAYIVVVASLALSAVLLPITLIRAIFV
jgi:hypothetical protein